MALTTAEFNYSFAVWTMAPSVVIRADHSLEMRTDTFTAQREAEIQRLRRETHNAPLWLTLPLQIMFCGALALFSLACLALLPVFGIAALTVYALDAIFACMQGAK
jgi:hypothetical protein